jgi:hypothetical protein
VAEPYSPFAFTSQNVTNTIIRNNRTRGGRAGLAVLKPCCRPGGIEFHDNVIGDVSAPLVAAQDLSAGVRIRSNVFCLKGPVDTGQAMLRSNNTVHGNCGKVVSPPQPLQVR